MMACLTAHVVHFCAETHYERCLRKVARFIVEQNEEVSDALKKCHFKSLLHLRFGPNVASS